MYIRKISFVQKDTNGTLSVYSFILHREADTTFERSVKELELLTHTYVI